MQWEVIQGFEPSVSYKILPVQKWMVWRKAVTGRRLRVKGLFVTWVRWMDWAKNTNRTGGGNRFPSAQNKSGRQSGGTHTNMLQTLKHVRRIKKNQNINSWEIDWIGTETKINKSLCFDVGVCVCFLETGSHIAQTGLELTV